MRKAWRYWGGGLGLLLWLTLGAHGSTPETVVWLAAPARDFTESSPMGNGRLGAMLFGGVATERIVLNESSVWSGSRQNADRTNASAALPEIRRLLLAGKNVEAEALVNAHFTCQGPGSAGGQYGCYQVLGKLHLNFTYGSPDAPVTQYRRQLDLEEAVTRVTFTRGDVAFQREMFVSAPDEAMVLRLSAGTPGQISFTLGLDRPERFATVTNGPDQLIMTGQLDNGVDGKGVRYAARVRVLNQGGRVTTTGNQVRVAAADEVLLLITAATDYQGFAGRQTKDPVQQSATDLRRAGRKNYATLRRAHVVDYQKFFRRTTLQLGPVVESAADRPTPERIQALQAGAEDPALAALYFNFGRYLLISSSRPGGFPANLQGLWAEELATPWTGDWHLDVNVQMNYWLAEVGNLSELHAPLFALIASLSEPGARTAREYYSARGWVAHVITNPWGFTSPGEAASWGASTSGSAWLCQHLYDHYLFTRDRRFLKWAYPILKGAAQFYADMLIEEPTHHWLVVAPANSPENRFRLPDGREASICMGPTMHSQLVRHLFSACVASAEILDLDAAFREELAAKLKRLPPTRIGSDGRVLEWLEEYAEPEPHHRHLSHLWGLYPGDEISPRRTPELAQAAAKSLETRGDDGVGWSLAYKVALWARLQNGDRAHALLRKALAPASGLEIRYDAGGGVYPNLFDASPPFQIDGNFGVAAALAEMLVQSQEATIELLPALPRAWPEGKVTGLRARGGFQVDLEWRGGELQRAVIQSALGGPCRVSYRGQERELATKKGRRIVLDGALKTIP